MKRETKRQITAMFILLIFAGSSIAYAFSFFVPQSPTANAIKGSHSAGVGRLGSTHEHVDFKVYIEGQQIDFSQERYQVRSQFIHVEDGDGDIIHIHATGETIGFFFDTVDISFTSECIIVDSGLETEQRYCTAGDKTLKFYVNGEPNILYDDYLLKDLDKILVSYGSETEEQIQEQLNSITDKAATQSGESGPLPFT